MKERPSKRPRSSSPYSSADESPALDAMEIFRRHFESRFEAIEETSTVPSVALSNVIDEGSDTDSEWNGISSDTEEPPVVQVIHHISSSSTPPPQRSRRELKAFMSSKPPTSLFTSLSTTPTPAPTTLAAADADDDDNDTENLANDLALQRLLAESHLLDPASDTLEAKGTQRLKALQLRIEALGGKRLETQKMGMIMKKGVEGKKVKREKKRRGEAKEAGVVLEKEVKTEKVRRKRGRNVGMPTVGKWKGGALVLSKRDVGEITGGREKGGSGRGEKRGRGGKRK